MNVEISAQVGNLKAGLEDASSSIKKFATDVQENLGKTSTKAGEFGGKMETALDLGIFLEFKEIATQAFEAVQMAIEMTAQKAMEFGLENAKFAAMMGTTTEKAAGLDAALKSVGISLQEYEFMSMRMQMRLKTQEEAFNALGMATRDHNGQLLQGEAMMDSAISSMQKYKVGIDQNEFALQVFGRRAQDVYDIMRVQGIEQQTYIQDMKDLGVQTGDTASTSVEFEAALGRQHQQWEDLGIALGQRFMPILVSSLNWMNNEGKPILASFTVVMISLADTVIALGTAFYEAYLVIRGAVAGIMTASVGMATIVGDIATGSLGNLQHDTEHTMAALRYEWDTTATSMASAAKTAQAAIDSMGKPLPAGENPFEKGGGKDFVPFDPQAAAMARKIMDEILQSEEKLALESVKIDENKNNTLFQLGQITTDQFTEQQENLENKKYQIMMEFLQKKAEADKGDVLSHQKDLDQINQITVAHTEAVLRIYEQAAVRKQQIDRADLEAFKQQSEERLSDDIADVETAFQRNEITAQTRAQLEKNLTTVVVTEVLKRKDAEIAGLEPATEAYKRAYKEREEIVRKFTNDVKTINNTLVADERQKWETLGSSIKSSFNGAVNGMLVGGMTFGKGMQQLTVGILTSFLTMVEEMCEKWIAMQLSNAIFGKTIQATTNVSEVMGAAAVAFANAYAATAAIPIVGPELAPSVAAGAYATVASMAPLASAAGGMVLDRDQLVSAHKKEMILPAYLSQGIEKMITNNNGTGGVNLQYSPTINSKDHKSLKEMLSQESSEMLSWLKEMGRNGALSGVV